MQQLVVDCTDRRDDRGRSVVPSAAYMVLTPQEQADREAAQAANKAARLAEQAATSAKALATAGPPEGSYAPGSYTIATGKWRSAVMRQQFTTNQRLTIQGNGRLSIRDH